MQKGLAGRSRHGPEEGLFMMSSQRMILGRCLDSFEENTNNDLFGRTCFNMSNLWLAKRVISLMFNLGLLGL